MSASSLPALAREAARQARGAHPVELGAFLDGLAAAQWVDRFTARSGLRLAEVGGMVRVDEALDGHHYVTGVGAGR